MDDWAKEAAIIGKVYTHSYFTLAALSSKDSTEGLKIFSGIQQYGLEFLDIGVNSDENRLLQCQLRNRWFQLLERYSEQSPTKDIDKLPALSGIAQAYSRGSGYIAPT